MTMKIKDSQVKAILAEVEAEIGSLLKAETDRLAKAGEESPGEDEGSESGGPPPASPAGPAGPSASPDASAAPDASASPADASASPEAPPMDAPPAEGAPVDPAADQGPVDPEALMAEYAKLPPEELKVHFMACKAAMAQVMGADPEAAGAGAPPPMASPSPAGGPPPPGASPSPAPLMQNELEVPANGGTQRAAVPDAIKSEKAAEGARLSKSEDRVKELEATLADQATQIDLLAKAVDLVVGQPMRKAVVGVGFVPKTVDSKSEPSKDEISAKLNEAIRSKKLSKAEGERVIAYSMGHIGYEQIKDLLEKK